MLAAGAGDLPQEAENSAAEFSMGELPPERPDGSYLPTVMLPLSPDLKLEVEMLVIPDSFLPSFPDGSSLLEAAVKRGHVELVRTLLSVRAQDRLLDSERQAILEEAIRTDGRTNNK